MKEKTGKCSGKAVGMLDDLDTKICHLYREKRETDYFKIVIILWSIDSMEGLF